MNSHETLKNAKSDFDRFDGEVYGRAPWSTEVILTQTAARMQWVGSLGNEESSGSLEFGSLTSKS